MKYKEWLKLRSQSEKRDVSKDNADYDMKKFHKESGGAANQSGHLPDTYKKPNHPTFSNESAYSNPLQQGGSWDGNKFKPSEHNLKNMPAGHLQMYFNREESPEALDIENSKKLSRERYLSKLRK